MPRVKELLQTNQVKYKLKGGIIKMHGPDNLRKVENREMEIDQATRKKKQTIISYFQDQKIRLEKSIQSNKERFQGESEKSFAWIVISHSVIALIVYAMVIPIIIFDVCGFLYQHIAFRVYGIPIVKRKDYFVIDRHHLEYLNRMDQFNCVYCGYANGVAAYCKEIIARTEQYWCPIKHETDVKDPHTRYGNFFEYGDGKGYQENIAAVVRKYDNEE